MDRSVRVEPDGPIPCSIAVVGDAPAREEVKYGRGFVGPSGKLLWPLLEKITTLRRSQCYVTNLCKHPLDNDTDTDAKLDELDMAVYTMELEGELEKVQPKVIYAVGTLAARALLGDRFTTMAACNGRAFSYEPLSYATSDGTIVIPIQHPASAIRGNSEDGLAMTGAGLMTPTYPVTSVTMPTPKYWTNLEEIWLGTLIAIDTEGTPDDPICLTFSNGRDRYYIAACNAKTFWEWCVKSKPRDGLIAYHNALWDWQVMEAMGITNPYSLAFVDTQEMSYLRQTEPRGLKDIGYRLFDIRMKSFEETVLPHYYEQVREHAQMIVDGNTKIETHTAKGKLRKKPKVTIDPSVRHLSRVMGNPKLLAKRMGWWGGESFASTGTCPPTLRHAPPDVAMEYATLDAHVTYHAALLWGVR